MNCPFGSANMHSFPLSSHCNLLYSHGGGQFQDVNFLQLQLELLRYFYNWFHVYILGLHPVGKDDLHN